MASTTPAPLISVATDDHQALGDAVAAHVADLPHPPQLLGFGEPMHGEEEFLRLRNAVYVGLVERAGFTSIALESSAWHGRIVDAHVRGGDRAEDDVMAAGFTHGFGDSAANRALVRWMRDQNRHRPPAAQLRFAAFDAPLELMGAPSPRPALQMLHDYLRTHAGGDVGLPRWDTVDQLLGPDDPWCEPGAAMDPARSVGSDPRVAELRAVTDDLRWRLTTEAPRLRRETGTDDVEDAALAGRTAAGLLAYHAAMARDTEQRWAHLAAVRDTMMAENLLATAARGRTMVFAHNHHLRTGTTSMSLGPMTVRWQPAGAHVADRLGADYRVIACALGDAPGHDVPVPPPRTVEGLLHRDLPPGNHLLPASALRALQPRSVPRTSTNLRYLPVDATLLDEIDEILFLHTIGDRTAPTGAAGSSSS